MEPTLPCRRTLYVEALWRLETQTIGWRTIDCLGTFAANSVDGLTSAKISLGTSEDNLD